MAKKKTTKTTKTTRKKVPKPRRRKSQAVSVGDEVQVPLESRNEYQGYDVFPHQVGSPGQLIHGLICSIREVSSGELVGVAAGNFRQYVFEILHSNSFHPRFGTERNSEGSQGPGGLADNPVWSQLRQQIREAAKRGKLVSHAAGHLDEEPFASLLDGWRIVKVWTGEVESLEETAAPAS